MQSITFAYSGDEKRTSFLVSLTESKYRPSSKRLWEQSRDFGLGIGLRHNWIRDVHPPDDYFFFFFCSALLSVPLSSNPFFKFHAWRLFLCNFSQAFSFTYWAGGMMSLERNWLEMIVFVILTFHLQSDTGCKTKDDGLTDVKAAIKNNVKVKCGCISKKNHFSWDC